MGAWRMRPPPVQQGPLQCWAAAISSWSRVVSRVKDFTTIRAVIDEFRRFAPDEINTDGTLKTPSGWIAFAKEFDLKIEEILLSGAPTPGIRVTRASDLKLSHFESKLQSSHVLVVIAPETDAGMSHTVVVYGADRFHICFMDPLQDPAATGGTRPAGGAGRVAKNWFCDAYEDFGVPAQRYLLIWRG